jgi:hypothetical protein
MTENTSPTFSSKCEILGQLWLEYRSDEQFADFIEYNDIGIPLSYFISGKIALPTELSEKYINETYDLLVEALGVSDSETYETLEDMLADSTNK